MPDSDTDKCFNTTMGLIALGIFMILITAYFIEQFTYDEEINQGRPAPNRVLYNESIHGPSIP